VPDLTYYKGTPVPLITTWSQEVSGAPAVPLGAGARIVLEMNYLENGTATVGRVRYADESIYDRDTHGVLWQRYPVARGRGFPYFARVHPLRQRRCMNRLLCQVCGEPAAADERGTLFMLTFTDAAGVRAGTQDTVLTSNPPVCAPCSELAARRCPHLGRGNAAVYARTVTPWGVYGILAAPEGNYSGQTAAYADQRIHRMIAGQQMVTLSGLTLTAF
jgi:hypothetical protein